MAVKGPERYLGSGGPSEEQVVPASSQPPQPRVPVLGREVLTTDDCENRPTLRLSKMKAAGGPGVPLKGPTRGLTG